MGKCNFDIVVFYITREFYGHVQKMLVGSPALERIIVTFSDFLTATCKMWTAIERAEFIQNTF
jgi:hypothetical protein